MHFMVNVVQGTARSDLHGLLAKGVVLVSITGANVVRCMLIL